MMVVRSLGSVSYICSKRGCFVLQYQNFKGEW